MEITTEQLTTMVTEAAQKGAEAAVRAVNTVDPAERPGGGKSAKAEPTVPEVNVNLKRNQTPNMGRALRAAFLGKWKDAPLEKDFSQAVRALYPTNESEGDFSWPTTVEAYYNVLEAGAFRDVASDFQKAAYRAISEGTPTTSASGGGVLTPIAFLQDQFVTALTSPVAVLAAPGTDVIPITNPVVSLPRESTAAHHGGRSRGRDAQRERPDLRPADLRGQEALRLRPVQQRAAGGRQPGPDGLHQPVARPQRGPAEGPPVPRGLGLRCQPSGHRGLRLHHHGLHRRDER